METVAGSGPEARAEGELVFSAVLAARGMDPSGLRPGDLRVEVIRSEDGSEVTTFSLRAGLLTPAEPG